MIKHGQPPYLECSSAGDRRFSAFYARLRAYGNKSIEEIYQAAKVFEDGTTGLNWREAKGRQPVNAAQCAQLYASLWDTYIREQPQLIPVLTAASGISDKFGRPGRQCQATELWRISERERAHALQRELPIRRRLDRTQSPSLDSDNDIEHEP
jgi:hypothetical protein